ncbi:MAG: hypothetical protein V1889_02840 [archaeon]
MDKLVCKRGAGHFEMIISFVFFVGFVFFLFLVLRTSGGSRISGAVISGLYDSFEEEVYTNLSDVFLKANYTGGDDCFYVELPGRVFSYALGGGDSYVTGLGGVDVDSGLEENGDDGDLNLDVGEKFFRVSISPEFSDEGLDECEVLDNYKMGAIDERRVVSYSALASMASEYYIDYEGVKDDLRVPDIFDFAIIPESLTAVKMEPQSGIPDSVDVFAEDYVVEVLYSNGTVVNERFTLKVW